VPVIVELFSSEGCSSCPPADAYLRRLATTQPVAGVTIVPLELHVDYWDDIGWKDPYSSSQYTERQRTYARAFADDRIYTPELVVQGGTPVSPGGTSTLAVIEKAAERGAIRITVAHDHDLATVHVTDAKPGANLEVWLAVTESGLVSRVTSGENSGKTLEHAAIARRLVHLGDVKGAAFDGSVAVPVAADWKAPNLRYVAFVQERVSRRILAAAVR
jgi:hypothetical protein